MQHINRLLQAARRAAQGSGKYACAFVDYDESINKWTATAQIWDGVSGSFNTGGVVFLTIEPAETAEAAANAIEALKNEKCPGVGDMPVLIMDYGDLD